MKNNDFFRRLRYALNLKDDYMLKIFREVNLNIKKEVLLSFFKREEEEDFLKMSNAELLSFLEGFIILKRGRLENSDEKKQENIKINKNNFNNILLRKLKIALSLKSDEMLKVFEMGGQKISSSELSALFRKEDHKNYRECGDKYIRIFLKGLRKFYIGD